MRTPLFLCCSALLLGALPALAGDVSGLVTDDAGRPLEAVCLAAMGLRTLSMRPASIGPVKSILRRTNLAEVRNIIVEARERGDQSVRPAVMEYMRNANSRS